MKHIVPPNLGVCRTPRTQHIVRDVVQKQRVEMTLAIILRNVSYLPFNSHLTTDVANDYAQPHFVYFGLVNFLHHKRLQVIGSRCLA